MAKTLGQIIDDFTTLDVVTLTGNLTLQVKDLDDGDPDNSSTSKKPLKFQDIMKKLEGSVLKDKSQISALAATHVAIDKDTVTFVKEDLNTQEATLLDFHNETVKAAGFARAAMAEGLAKLFKAK